MIVDGNLDIEGESPVSSVSGGVSRGVLGECLEVCQVVSAQPVSMRPQVSVCVVEPRTWSSPTLCLKEASAGFVG